MRTATTFKDKCKCHLSMLKVWIGTDMHMRWALCSGSVPACPPSPPLPSSHPFLFPRTPSRQRARGQTEFLRSLFKKKKEEKQQKASDREDRVWFYQEENKQHQIKRDGSICLLYVTLCKLAKAACQTDQTLTVNCVRWYSYSFSWHLLIPSWQQMRGRRPL